MGKLKTNEVKLAELKARLESGEFPLKSDFIDAVNRELPIKNSDAYEEATALGTEYFGHFRSYRQKRAYGALAKKIAEICVQRGKDVMEFKDEICSATEHHATHIYRFLNGERALSIEALQDLTKVFPELVHTEELRECCSCGARVINLSKRATIPELHTSAAMVQLPLLERDKDADLIPVSAETILNLVGFDGDIGKLVGRLQMAKITEEGAIKVVSALTTSLVRAAFRAKDLTSDE